MSERSGGIDHTKLSGRSSLSWRRDMSKTSSWLEKRESRESAENEAREVRRLNQCSDLARSLILCMNEANRKVDPSGCHVENAYRKLC